jgi:hypothetical protein
VLSYNRSRQAMCRRVQTLASPNAYPAGMKTQEHRATEAQRSRSEADLEVCLETLFSRCPSLCGFSVREAAYVEWDGSELRRVQRLLVTEVSVYPFSFLDPPPELCDEIVAQLAQLIDECPYARELLRERTFARTLH